MKKNIKKLIKAKWFDLTIISVILVNCFLIGVETYFKTPLIHAIQTTALVVFAIEIFLRILASDGFRQFFSDSWNVFDLFIVLISFVPESLFENAATITALRVIRVFRVLRLLRTSPEIKLIIAVLSRSFSALSYNGLFFFIFMYLFAIIGVTIFKLPDPATASPETLAVLTEYLEKAPNAPTVAPDPYGSLHETMFTLFRVLTGEDWTDIRYNLIEAKRMGLIHVSETVVTGYHVIWFILSAFLLLNLLLGAIVNNYQVIMDDVRSKNEQKKNQEYT